MKKKNYEKPSSEVVELKQQTSLLQASIKIEEVDATMEGVWQEEDI